MKYETNRSGIRVVPENDEDEAYIEDTLGLKKSGDAILLVRQNAIGMSRLGSLATNPFPERNVRLVGNSLKLIGVINATLEENEVSHNNPGGPDAPLLHPAVVDIMQWFAYEHLPKNLQAISKPAYELAEVMTLVGTGPELTAGLRKLLEAKDCFVRAAIAAVKKTEADEEEE